MNKNLVKGTTKDGKAKETMGLVKEDNADETKGKLEQFAGTVQKTFDSAEEKLNDAQKVWKEGGKKNMGTWLWLIAIVLVVLWALGAFVVDLGGQIHLLLVVALVLVIVNLIRERK